MLIKLGELDAWTLSNKLHLRIELLELAGNRICRSLTYILLRIRHCTGKRLVDTIFQQVVAGIAAKQST